MNRLCYLITIIFCFSFGLFADDYDETRKEAAKRANAIVNKYEKALQAKKISKADKEFKLECYKIETIMDISIEIDSSTYGMIMAMDEAYVSYDKLLNKYYNLYRNTLNKESKKSFLEEQKAWIKVRDAYEEYAMYHTSNITTIMGGGTMYQLYAPRMNLEFLKKRVYELFNYYNADFE